MYELKAQPSQVVEPTFTFKTKLQLLEKGVELQQQEISSELKSGDLKGPMVVNCFIVSALYVDSESKKLYYFCPEKRNVIKGASHDGIPVQGNGIVEEEEEEYYIVFCKKIVGEYLHFTSMSFAKRAKLFATMKNAPFLPIDEIKGDTHSITGSEQWDQMQKSSQTVFLYQFWSLLNYFLESQNIDTKLLLPEEFIYIKSAFKDIAANQLKKDLVEIFAYSPDAIPHFSDFTISHEFMADKTNAQRFAVGGTNLSQETLKLVDAIMQTRGIERMHQYQFYGIGWDLGLNAFKIYYITKMEYAPHSLKLQADQLPYKMRDHILISYSYQINSPTIVEEKLYCYPIGAICLDDWYHITCAFMITDKRGVIYQYDCDYEDEDLATMSLKSKVASFWYKKVNDKGKQIIDHYLRHGILLDTIEFLDSNHFKLYFPLCVP